ncbi:ABC transporter permease [Paenibacillus chungangensis]|uniref:ABC transporter permease n=1 Tax=Paenibacillus chungangensis TaxID=696535 RepID=A0ABW3HSV1_9BACL
MNAMRKNPLLYALVVPGLLYFLIFYYVPMFGVIIAFKDYSPFQGIGGIFSSEWVGFQHFQDFFQSYSFRQVLVNTLLLSFYNLVFGFPAPIILALMLNEVIHRRFKKAIQTISYLPHFLSMVVVVGILHFLLSTDGGLLNEALGWFGADSVLFLGEQKFYRFIIVCTQIWQQIGWESIIFLAAMTMIDPQQYEAAVIDGAGKFKQMLYITLPGILPVIVIMLIFRIGNVLNVNFELILLTYSPSTYDVSDVIDTFVYREGLIGMKYSYTTAVGLFKSLFSAIMLLGANYLAKRFGQEGIW